MDRKTFILCYLISIATILGSGLLGLPVSIAQSGLTPFLVSFTINLLAQIAVVCLILELLQAAHVIKTDEINYQIKTAKNGSTTDKQGVNTNNEGQGQYEYEGQGQANQNFEYSNYNSNNNNNIGIDQNYNNGFNQSSNGFNDGPNQGQMGTMGNDDDDFDFSKFDEPDLNPEVKPTFYCLGNIFLAERPILKLCFLTSMLLNFLSLLISYCLAGSQAYSGMLPGGGLTRFLPGNTTKWLDSAPVQGIGYLWMVVFVVSLSAMILLHSQSAQFIVQVLTTGKALILAVSVFSVLFLSFNSEIVQSKVEDWSKLGSGFLMGTVALGEAAQVLPLLYSQIEKPTIYSLKELRKAIVLALLTCYILGSLWCVAILNLIPQGIDVLNYCNETSSIRSAKGLTTKMNPQSFDEIDEFDVVCNKHIYLMQASKRGMISSNPLTQLLDTYEDLGFTWLASMIRLFVALSITVSFLAVGSAMYHALKGWTKHLYELCIQYQNFNVEQCQTSYEKVEVKAIQLVSPVLTRLDSDEERQRFLGGLVFSFVALIAMINPKGFSNMLKYQTSLSLNWIGVIRNVLETSTAPSKGHD